MRYDHLTVFTKDKGTRLVFSKHQTFFLMDTMNFKEKTKEKKLILYFYCCQIY